MATPSWTDHVSVVAVTKVAAGSTTRGTLNVSGKFGGYVFLRAMRLSSTAPSNGIYVAVRRLLNGTPAGGTTGTDIVQPSALGSWQDSTTASNLTTLNGAPTIPGSTVTLTSATGFAAGQQVGIVDSTTAPTVFEVARTSKISGTTLTVDRNLVNTGLASGDTITNLLFAPTPLYVDGTPNSGDIEVIFDNGAESAVAYAVECWAQTLDSIS